MATLRKTKHRKPKAAPRRGKAPGKKSAPARKVKPATRKKLAKILAKKSAPRATRRAAGGLSDKLKDAALQVLKDRQATDIVTINLVGRSSLADYLLIASGRAARQIAAIADYLREAFTKLGAAKIRVEGTGQGDWVLVDAGDVVVHLFRPEVRRYYDLENIWEREDEDIEHSSLLIE